MKWIGRTQQDSWQRRWQTELRTNARARRREVFLCCIGIVFAFWEGLQSSPSASSMQRTRQLLSPSNARAGASPELRSLREFANFVKSKRGIEAPSAPAAAKGFLTPDSLGLRHFGPRPDACCRVRLAPSRGRRCREAKAGRCLRPGTNACRAQPEVQNPGSPRTC